MLIRTIFTILVLPPAFQFLVALLGVILWRFKKGLALACFGFSFFSLLLLSMPAVKALLYDPLEIYPPVAPEKWRELKNQPNTVIVILGGGKETQALEWGGETLTEATLARVRYGAMIAAETGFPILVTGGTGITDKGLSEAELMAEALAELGYDQVMLERLSKNTWENAKYTAELLARQGIDRIVLVTQAWHMRRSVYSFKQFGFEVIPAPTLFRANYIADLGYLPDPSALRESAAAIKEWLGLLVYAFFYEPPTQINNPNTQGAES